MRCVIFSLLPLALMNFLVVTEIESCSNFMHFYHFNVNYTCNSDQISTAISFKQPFTGTVFAKNFYADPKCSSPNLNVISTSEIKLVLPLLQCGTRVRRYRGLPRIGNTLIIQYNPILKSVNDSEVTMTCSPCESLPPEFWELYLQRDRNLKSRLDVRMAFEPGRSVLSEKVAGMLRVSNEMFLVIYVEDNFEYKDFNVRKCWAYNESVVNETTSVVLISEMRACQRTLIENITLERKNNELVGFTRVNLFNIVAKSNLYVSCALDFCKEICPNICLGESRSQESNQWSFVGTHKVIRSKRSIDESEAKMNERDLKNDLLKSRVMALTERFSKLKSQINENKNSNSSQKAALRILTYAPIEDKENNIGVYSSTEKIGSETDFTRRNIRSQERLDSAKNYSEVLLHVSAHTETLNNTAQDTSYNCSETFCTFFDDSAITEPTKIFTDTSTDIVKQINITTIYYVGQEVDKNKSSVSNDTSEIIGNTLLKSTTTTADCVPKLKFITVTVTLSLLTICMFLICIGVLLHSRKERKRQKLDSYFLFSSF